MHTEISSSKQYNRSALFSFLGPQSRLRLATGLGFYRAVIKGLVSGDASRATRTTSLEAVLADDIGTKNCTLTPMARTGIYATIKALIEPGQGVILSPYTISEVVNMVLCAGGVPVFCDTQRQTCNMDPNILETLFREEQNIGAVLVTHFYGLMSDMPQISALCEAYDVPLVEDAAQSFGASVDNKPAGTWGTAGVLSFGMFKSVNALYGGAIVTNDDILADKIRTILNTETSGFNPAWLRAKLFNAISTDIVTRDLFFGTIFFRLFRWAVIKDVSAITSKLKIDTDPKARHEMPAEYLHQVCDLQVDLIRRGLKALPYALETRRKTAAKYREGLKHLPNLILPPECQPQEHTYWYFAVQHDHPHELVEHVLKQGQDITISYHRNCADMPCFEPYHRPCPQAAATARSLIYLPCYPGYDTVQVERTIAAIKSFSST